MIKSRQLRGHRRQPKTIVEEVTFRVTAAQVEMARHVGVQPELIGQYLFSQTAIGIYGPGEARLHKAATDQLAGQYVLTGTHTRLA